MPITQINANYTTNNEVVDTQARLANADVALAQGKFEALSGDAVLRLAKIVRVANADEGATRLRLGSAVVSALAVYECTTITANAVLPNGTMLALQFSGPVAQVGDVVLVAQTIRGSTLVVLGTLISDNDSARIVPSSGSGQTSMVAGEAGIQIADEITKIDTKHLTDVGQGLPYSCIDLFAGKQQVGDINRTSESFIRLMHGGIVDDWIGIKRDGSINQWLQDDEKTEATDQGATIIWANDSIRIMSPKVDNQKTGQGGSIIIGFVDRNTGELASKISVTGDGRVSIAGTHTIDLQHITGTTASALALEESNIILGGRPTEEDQPLIPNSLNAAFTRTELISLLAESIGIHTNELKVFSDQTAVTLSTAADAGSFTRAEKLYQWFVQLDAILKTWQPAVNAAQAAAAATGAVLPVPLTLPPVPTVQEFANTQVKA